MCPCTPVVVCVTALNQAQEQITIDVVLNQPDCQKCEEKERGASGRARSPQPMRRYKREAPHHRLPINVLKDRVVPAGRVKHALAYRLCK